MATHATEDVLKLDMQRLVLSGAKEVVSVTDTDASVLSALARAPGQRLGFWQLHEVLGQLPNEANKASLEVRMVRLRKKITQASGDDGALKAIRGHGYQLCMALLLG
jgi:DNA-binding response OmpR family regulator